MRRRGNDPDREVPGGLPVLEEPNRELFPRSDSSRVLFRCELLLRSDRSAGVIILGFPNRTSVPACLLWEPGHSPSRSDSTSGPGKLARAGLLLRAPLGLPLL